MPMKLPIQESLGGSRDHFDDEGGYNSVEQISIVRIGSHNGVNSRLSCLLNSLTRNEFNTIVGSRCLRRFIVLDHGCLGWWLWHTLYSSIHGRGSLGILLGPYLQTAVVTLL
jgi:hypothetical protein